MITTKLVTGIVAGVLSVAVMGAVAFAAVQPPSASALVASIETGAVTAAHAEKGGDALQAVLARLVTNGTITQAQADAVLSAVKTAADEAREKAKEKAKERKDKAKERDGDREGAALVKRVFAGMMRLAVEYIGLPEEAVQGQLKAGKSLGEIADTQPGKSREGLIAHIVAGLTAQLDKLVAEGKITAERANEAKSHLREHVTRFVDHKYERKPSPPKERKEREAKKPAASPTAKPTT